MFIDNVRVHVKGGHGGRGCNSLYTDKLTRKGIPDGGDGGKGADVIFVTDKSLLTLLDFKFRQHLHGGDGAHGTSKKKKGKSGKDLVAHVPCGTLIIDAGTNTLIRDLDQNGESVVVARGGSGGLGNNRKLPATDGRPGEEREIILDLKLIADAGIIGFPNAGKSTLISSISHAHPKIAPYPFTTTEPALGVVRDDDSSFVIADIPGLIAGSHDGRGLGDRFLRHVERTRILLHLIDMAGTEGRDPLEDYRVINNELKLYSKEVAKKTQILIANKMDLEGAKANLARFKKLTKKKIIPISAMNKEGLEELVAEIRKKI